MSFQDLLVSVPQCWRYRHSQLRLVLLHGFSGFEPCSSCLHSTCSYPPSHVLSPLYIVLCGGIQSMQGTEERLYFAFALNSLCVSKHFRCNYCLTHSIRFENEKKWVSGRADAFRHRIHSKHLQLSPHLLHRTWEAQGKQHDESQFCLALHGSHQQ